MCILRTALNVLNVLDVLNVLGVLDVLNVLDFLNVLSVLDVVNVLDVPNILNILKTPLISSALIHRRYLFKNIEPVTFHIPIFSFFLHTTDILLEVT